MTATMVQAQISFSTYRQEDADKLYRRLLSVITSTMTAWQLEQDALSASDISLTASITNCWVEQAYNLRSYAHTKT